MVRALLLYFSATGNTDYVARYLARRLERPGVEVAFESVERVPPEDVGDHDVLVFGFPVYELDSPEFLRPYMEGLSPGEGRGAYVFCTKGAVAGGAIRRNLARLASRGYVPLGGASVGMPGSDGLALVGKDSRMARAALGRDFRSLKAADSLAEQMSTQLQAIASGVPVDSLARTTTRRGLDDLLRLIWASAYRAFGDAMRTWFSADKSCIACGLCERICPVGAVALVAGRPQFGSECALCMRCLHACPQEAIQIGNLTVGKCRWRGPEGDFRPQSLRPAAKDRQGP